MTDILTLQCVQTLTHLFIFAQFGISETGRAQSTACTVFLGELDRCCLVTGPLLRVLVSVFAPIYWTTVLQSGAARNGYSLTQGQFRQESQLEFETGASLLLLEYLFDLLHTKGLTVT